MRYFKYPYTKKAEETEIKKAELAAFDKAHRKLAVKAAVLRVLATALLLAAVIFLMVLSFMAAGSYVPEYKNLLQFFIALIAVRFLIFVFCMVLTVIISLLLSLPLFKILEKWDKKLDQSRREHLWDISQKACEELAQYYGLQEPSIVTKCYACSDNRFKKKDIIIFERDGEVRIIKNIFGTLNINERDIGCYAFKKGEFSLCHAEYKGKRSAELTEGEVSFTLAARAKPFAERLLAYEENGIFLPASKKKSGSSAYYELAFCKKDMPPEELLQGGYPCRSEDSLLFHMDDDSRFFRNYLRYFENPHSPDGSCRFYYAGVNYYTAEETAKILAEIEKDAPPYSAPLIAWLREAKAYNGIFFLGI